MKASKSLKKKYLSFVSKQEIKGEPFYDKIEQLEKFYLPICNIINKKLKSKNKPIIVGLSGAQGTGKSTISKILSMIFKNYYKINTINFSIDDFYKTLSERKKMSKNVHKLFKTRGVPGTHDTRFLNKTLKLLIKKNFKKTAIPKFDKSIDDRAIKSNWNIIKKKPQIIIFEGWCVGAKSQPIKTILKPINHLEKSYDNNLTWRKKVNNELKYNYKKIFNMIDIQLFLKIPKFKYVLKWRSLQEKKLSKNSKGKKIMNSKQIKTFIMYYERITKQMLNNSSRFDITIDLDGLHRLKKIKFN